MFNASDNVHLAERDIQAIDIADINQFPAQRGYDKNSIGTRIGKLAHEIAEQYEMQVNRLEGPDAHELGLDAEERVDGLRRHRWTDAQYRAGTPYIFENEYAQKTRENAIGRRTIYTNQRTGDRFLENVYYKRGGRTGAPLPIIEVLPPVKLK